MHQIDNCLESTGGDILEMSCTTIVSIPLVLGCMKAVSVSRRNRQGGPHGGVGGREFIMVLISRTQLLEAQWLFRGLS